MPPERTEYRHAIRRRDDRAGAGTCRHDAGAALGLAVRRAGQREDHAGERHHQRAWRGARRGRHQPHLHAGPCVSPRGRESGARSTTWIFTAWPIFTTSRRWVWRMRSPSRAILLVEWSERFHLRSDWSRLAIHLEHLEGDSRRIVIDRLSKLRPGRAGGCALPLAPARWTRAVNRAGTRLASPPCGAFRGLVTLGELFLPGRV